MTYDWLFEEPVGEGDGNGSKSLATGHKHGTNWTLWSVVAAGGECDCCDSCAVDT